jgi:hypothetical protein
MSDPKLPARRTPPLPSIFKDITSSDQLTQGRGWFERSALDRKTRTVDSSTANYLARQKQSDAYTALIEARMRIARTLAELADLPNLIAEEQHQREHVRLQNDHRRALERAQAIYDLKIALARNDAELSRLKEKAVRAERNHEAALRVKDTEIDAWYAQARSRANSATAQFQDTAADLARGPLTAVDPAATAAAATQQREHDIAALDHEIELQRGRGDQHAVLALMNAKARLKAS